MKPTQVTPNETNQPVTDKYIDPEYKGEPLKDELLNGPCQNRGCTDILCCILFTSFILAWLIVGFYGFANGDPIKLTYPFDIDNNQCGKPGGDAEDFPYLYYPFPIPYKGLSHYKACVKKCPDSYSYDVKCYLETNSSLGNNCDFNCTEMGLCDELNSYFGSSINGIYPSEKYLGRFCLPDSDLDGEFKEFYDNVVDYLKIDVVQEWLSDVYVTWEVMFIVAGFAFALCFVYMVFIRYCIGFIVWVSILLTLSILILMGAFLHWAAYNLYDSDTDPKTVRNLKILAIVFYILSFISLIYLFYMCNKIRLAIAIMKVGTQYIRDVWHSLLIPPCFFIFTVVLYIYWSLACIFIYSCGEVKKREGSNPFASVEWTNSERNAFYFEFWGVLWSNAFLLSLCQFILASSVCIWYFAQNTDSAAQQPVQTSIYRAFRYHLGSLAFGSFILAVIWTIKYTLQYIQYKLKQSGADQNTKVVQWLLGILQCYVHCFERFIKFLNKNAFIQIALQGSNFCTAAREAFFIILRNASRFLAAGSIGAIFMHLGKWVITLGSAYGGYMIIINADRWNDKIHSPIFPTVLFMLIAYMIAGIFMSVYGMACDTILQCFLVDEELSSKKGRPAGHSPEILADFMGKEKHRDQRNRCCDCL